MRQNLFDSIFSDCKVVKNLFIDSWEQLVGAGAASLEVIFTLCESTGADAVTLADGERDGQIKVFVHEVDGGSIVITPATMNGASNTTVTMVTAGDCVAFIWLNGAWHLLWSTPNIEGTPLAIA